jgi:phenylacetate-CoA ligase
MEAEAGRLRIDLRSAASVGEPLLPEVRAAVESQWGIEVLNVYGMSEGLYANCCHRSKAAHLPDDLCIVEPVDAAGYPVSAGQRAAKFYLTNLYNFTTPLSRSASQEPSALLAGRYQARKSTLREGAGGGVR